MVYRPGLLVSIFSLVVVATAPAQTRIVTGRVTDSLTSETITSGQVSVQGMTLGTTIKEDGTFTLAVPDRDVTLSVRSIGFKRKDLQLPVNTSSAQVELARDYFQLEAIIVTGQATGVERKNLANAVATVSAQQLSAVPAASLDQALQGKMAGAEIIRSSGAPGGGEVVRLRGLTSINGAFTPLYVIDGVIASDVALPRGTNFVTQASRGSTIATQGENAVNRIADLNPNDIESVEVLKGAAASAIYGSKASNGVIMVTTKRGRLGAPQFTVSQKVGVSAASKLLGSRVFQSQADAVAVYGAKALDPATGWVAGQVFDNERELAGFKPLSYQTTASMSGGTETTRYYTSALVKHDGGIVKNTYADQRSLRVNVDQNVARRLDISLGADLVNTAGDKGVTINENNNTSYWAGFSNTPNFFDMRAVCPGGSRKAFCEGGIYPVNPYVQVNPLQTASLFKNREDVWRMIGTSRVTLDAIATSQHTLRFIANGGMDFFNQENLVYSPPELQFESLDGLLGTSIASSANNLNYNINANAVHTLKTGGGSSATTQIGIQYETRELKVNRILAANLVGGLQTVTSGTTIGIDGRHELVKDLGFFAQEEFLTFGERLLLTAGIRADRSSSNGDPHKLFYYPKASASYRLTGLARGLVDELKLRAAFGESGNQPLYGQKFTELVGQNVEGVPAALISASHAASDIVPERQREIELGFDGTLFAGRAHLEATGYEKRITDLLLARSLAASYGFTSEFLNGGVLRTRGVELTLSGMPIRGRALQWSPRVIFQAYRSVIVELPVPTFGGGGFPGGSVRIEEGKSATQVIGDDSLPDGTKTLGYIGETRPDYTLQLGSDLKFRALSFSFLWDRQKGGTVSARTAQKYDLNRNSADYDDPAPVAGRKLGEWRATTAVKQARLFLQDASFWKLREVTLGLDVPQSMVRKMWSGARSVRLSLGGRNLLTFTKYRGTDPEQRWRPDLGLTTLPIELWGYPPSRSFWFSVDLGL
ncbi:MAG: SusC/RagA family TonB-linked outer membrane protein [Gemmatimonadetes bacterium]|nr:SusC/RagA family TonB-linked outer membrane protein [Gemmatimonadota bacterium]